MLNNTDDYIDFFLSISAYSLPLTQNDCPWLWLCGSVGNMQSPAEGGPHWPLAAGSVLPKNSLVGSTAFLASLVIQTHYGALIRVWACLSIQPQLGNPVYQNSDLQDRKLSNLSPLKRFSSALASVAQLVKASSHKLKGHGFDYQSGHMPGLWVLSPVRVW